MKIKIKEEEIIKKFEPITLELTFESLNEVKALWHRLNECRGRYEEKVNKPNKAKISFEDFCKVDPNNNFWNELDNILRENKNG